MVLAYDGRQATHDIDVAILSPHEARIVRDLAKKSGGRTRLGRGLIER